MARSTGSISTAVSSWTFTVPTSHAGLLADRELDGALGLTTLASALLSDVVAARTRATVRRAWCVNQVAGGGSSGAIAHPMAKRFQESSVAGRPARALISAADVVGNLRNIPSFGVAMGTLVSAGSGPPAFSA